MTGLDRNDYDAAWGRLVKAVNDLPAAQAFQVRRRLADVQSAHTVLLGRLVRGPIGGDVA